MRYAALVFDCNDLAGGLQIGNEYAVPLFDWPANSRVRRAGRRDLLFDAAFGI